MIFSPLVLILDLDNSIYGIGFFTFAACDQEKQSSFFEFCFNTKEGWIQCDIFYINWWLKDFEG